MTSRYCSIRVHVSGTHKEGRALLNTLSRELRIASQNRFNSIRHHVHGLISVALEYRTNLIFGVQSKGLNPVCMAVLRYEPKRQGKILVHGPV